MAIGADELTDFIHKKVQAVIGTLGIQVFLDPCGKVFNAKRKVVFSVIDPFFC